MELISEKNESFVSRRVEVSTSCYSTTDDFLQCIYSVFVAKNHQKFQSWCLVYEFSFTGIF